MPEGLLQTSNVETHSELLFTLPAEKSIASRLGWRDCDVAERYKGAPGPAGVRFGSEVNSNSEVG